MEGHAGTMDNAHLPKCVSSIMSRQAAAYDYAKSNYYLIKDKENLLFLIFLFVQRVSKNDKHFSIYFKEQAWNIAARIEHCSVL